MSSPDELLYVISLQLDVCAQDVHVSVALALR